MAMRCGAPCASRPARTPAQRSSAHRRSRGPVTAESGGLDDVRTARHSTGGAAALVGLGILGSRVLGLVRQILVAGFLGADIAADAFMAALRIPNTLQNLFGEGALSAAFIPVYSRL